MTVKNIVAAFMIVFTVLLSSFAYYAYQVYNTPNILVDREDAYFAIPSGSSFRDVQVLLYDGGYVQDAVSFGLLSRLKDYDKLVKPGLYLLKADMSNNDAINLLRSGQQTPTRITFNGIRKLEELPEKITSGIELTPMQFEKLLFDKDRMISYGFDSLNYISMFLPNTYEVYWTITADELLKRMHEEYKRFWNESRRGKAESMGLSTQEVSTLASIVQSETAKLDEADRITGVYLNRLKRGMALQADPTLIFALNDFTIRRVLNTDKTIKSPYNTYINKGLPPGPIRIPDGRYIDAALNFEDHNFIYFCAKEDFSGYHAYATNLSDHMVNARRFQKAMNQSKIFR
ncbi:MAG: endolytic transglycosylase MltG [Bacteroidetes bacterium]|nr:endolytic transglycosylase MltG [Bacteroidota bacterium]MDA1121564.1 endolytic transglycosylase MltG [Bacteroidota bacterium]